METNLRIKLSELDMGLIKRIKALFGDEREVVLTIQAEVSNDLVKTESKKEYLSRLEKAITNLEQGKKVEMSEAQLDDFVLQQVKR